MVTTRRQTRRNGADSAAEDSSILEAPSPAPAPSRRQRKLPVRGRAAAAATAPAAEEDRGGESSRVVDVDDDEEDASSHLDSSLVVEIRAKTDSDEQGVAIVADDEADGVEADTTITGPEQPGPEPEIEEPPSSHVKPTAVFTGTKKTFGDDDDGDVEEVDADLEDATAEKLTIAPSISEPSDDESDSDAAPEAVSTTKSAAQAIKSAKAANKAIAEQAKAQKRKRQERTVRLQEQATTRKAAATPKKAGSDDEMPDVAGEGHGPASGGSGSDNQDDDMTPRTQLHLESAAAFSAARRRSSAAQTPSAKPPALPALLPDEFLDSDSEGDAGEDDGGGDGATRRPRKARKLATADRALTRDTRRAAAPGPDRVVGSTLYRAAAKKRDERLAPRSSKASANLKRDLLIRGRTAVKAKKGFFV